MVRRLLYAPRAYAFVYSESLQRVVDVSDDIVSGWVDRSDNDMGQAELVLRNVNRKYLRTADNRQVFQFDDLITIWLQRLPGQPVQVFTGYLDSVPAWQMYPGDCRISASDTTKRLAYSWFDPGSKFFMDLASRHNWYYDPTTGTGMSTETYGATDKNGNVKPAALDGGMAQFMHEFMTEVAGWDPSMFMIGEIDPTLIDKADQLKQLKLNTLRDSETVFAETMRRFIGMDAIDVVEVDGIRANGTVNQQITRAVRAIKKEVDNTDVPLQFAVYAAQARSGLRASYAEASTSGPDTFGYGLFRFQPKPNGVDIGGDFGTSTEVTFEDKIDGKSISSYVGSVKSNMDLFKKKYHAALISKFGEGVKGKRAANSWLNALDSNKAKELLSLMGLEVDGATSDAAYDNADKYIKSVVNGERVSQSDTTSTSTNGAQLDWDSEELSSVLSDDEKKTLAKYKTHHKSLIPYLYFAKKHMGEDVKLVYPPGVQKESLYLTGKIERGSTPAKSYGLPDDGEARGAFPTLIPYSGALVDLFYAFYGHKEVSSVAVSASTKVSNADIHGAYMYQGQPGLGSRESGADLLQDHTLRIVVSDPNASAPEWTEVSAPVDTSDNVLEGKGFSFVQLGQFSTLAALQAQYTFGQIGTMAESRILDKDRALLNDLSCLDGVKQLAQGSLRNLMALPNGRICAYYPDYFGARRGPYWYIREIEIVNMGVQLTDAPLATHVYTTGDTNVDNSIDITDRAISQGVVSVFDVELVNAFLIPGVLTRDVDPNKVGISELLSKKFLNKHGARVLREENPLVKHPWYEFLLAWQRFMQQWAATYDTLVEFTFQPEVMPGGILGFREHNLQMYCKQVRHDFSYENGFNTSATLNSPAAIQAPNGQSANPSLALPGMVIASGINTVAGGS